MARLTFEKLWVDGRWLSGATVEWDDSGKCVLATRAASETREPSEYIRGLTLPGLASAHCHAFQRILPPWTQHGGARGDDFWTWRNLMYAAAGCLEPQDLEAIAARCYLDLLRGGYTGVAEFLYLHRLGATWIGGPNADEAIASAAERVGIGLTLLPTLYQHSDFGRAPPTREQSPFVRTAALFSEDWSELKRRYASDPSITLGMAFHSLRAVDIETVQAVSAEVGADPACRAIHIHVSEQKAEVAGCLRHWNRTPIDLLLERGLVNSRWTLVHGTHATRAELEGICNRGATLALCPTTEADLGDGIPDAAPYLLAGGHLAIGSDSNVSCNAFAELRLLEWSQRLLYGRRNVLSSSIQRSVADRLYQAALKGGWRSLAKSDRTADEALQADFVTFDDDGTWRCLPPENWLSALVFGYGEPKAQHVIAGGRWLIRDGVHEKEVEIELAYRAALSRLRPTLIEAQSLCNQNGDHPC